MAQKTAAQGVSMKADFLDAHGRHWHDAEHLFEAQRWANADHLFGLAAECGLKSLMLAFGMTLNVSKDRPLSKDDQKHADGIWSRFESYRSGHARGTGYVLPSINPFDNWQVSQRYAHHSQFDQARVDEHRGGAETVRNLVRHAQLEGLI